MVRPVFYAVIPFSYNSFALIICVISLYILCNLLYVLTYSISCCHLTNSEPKECNFVCLHMCIHTGMCACMHTNTDTDTHTHSSTFRCVVPPVRIPMPFLSSEIAVVCCQRPVIDRDNNRRIPRQFQTITEVGSNDHSVGL